MHLRLFEWPYHAEFLVPQCSVQGIDSAVTCVFKYDSHMVGGNLARGLFSESPSSVLGVLSQINR